MAEWQDRYWTSADGDVRLHYRDYDGPRDQPPILCLPGLTRNARDFEPLADRFAGDWRILAVDLRGRGDSEADPDPGRYAPDTYAADVLKLLDQLGIAEAVFVGTSLGGIITMLMATTDPERIAGALLNDIGPEIDPRGIARIGGYVGKATRFGSWDEAVASIRERNQPVYPDYGAAEWDRFARRLLVDKGGGFEFAYDMAIAGNFHAAAEAPPVDAWPYYEALAGIPLTILRGELSDLLASETAAEMVRRLPQAELVIVPRVGHTPSFDEPESLDALARLLARIER